MTQHAQDVRRRGRRRGDRDGGEREPGRLLLAIVGLGRARVPRPDDVSRSFSTGSRLRVACASHSPALMVALGVWIALSSLWSISTSASIREVERMLVYVAVALAVAFVLRRGDGPAVLGGSALGVDADLRLRARDATLPRSL